MSNPLYFTAYKHDDGSRIHYAKDKYGTIYAIHQKPNGVLLGAVLLEADDPDGLFLDPIYTVKWGEGYRVHIHEMRRHLQSIADREEEAHQFQEAISA